MGISGSRGIFSTGSNSNSFRFKKPKTDYMSISLGWIHHFKKVYFTIGLYSLFDPPQFKMFNKDSFPPIGPYFNFCWVIKTKKANNK